MRQLICHAIAGFLATAIASAAPISQKELELMVRMKVPENEILQDVQSRRLLTPVDATAERSLLTNGATAPFVQRLKNGNFAVSADEALVSSQRAAEDRAALERERAADKAAFDARQRNLRGAVVPSDKMRTLFEGKLVRLQGGELKPYSADELRGIRCYALYYSAHWCAPCRKFTPELVKFYQRFKAAHPDFEVIFVSNDHNADAMQQYMKEVGMPWPAVRFDKIDRQLSSFAGSGIPWLGLYSDAGVPISNNGNTKQWADPGAILTSFEQAVAKASARPE